MRNREGRVALSVLAALSICACGGGGGSVAPPALRQAPPASSGATAASATRTYQLASAAGSYDLPALGGFGGSLAFPAATVPANTLLGLTSSLQAPTGLPVFTDALRRSQATGTFNVYFYTTIRVSSTVTFPTLPGFSVTLPATIDPNGLDFFYAISNPSPTNGSKSQFQTEGPATVAGQTVTFAASDTSLTLQAGQPYVIVFYAISAIAPSPTPTPIPAKIYLAYSNYGLVSYTANGALTAPTIPLKNPPWRVALGPAGKIYALSESTVTTYLPNGRPTTPTITAGLNGAFGIAVDAAGKIYVANLGGGTVTTYTAKGVQTTPTIKEPTLAAPIAVAVDAAGKIYVVNDNEAVTTYNPDGSRTTPTIDVSQHCSTDSIAVDKNGKIYLTDECDMLWTYTKDGAQTTPTFYGEGLQTPSGVAVDASGKIFVLNDASVNGGIDSVTTYTPSGVQTTPTINGLFFPMGIAVR